MRSFLIGQVGCPLNLHETKPAVQKKYCYCSLFLDSMIFSKNIFAYKGLKVVNWTEFLLPIPPTTYSDIIMQLLGASICYC